MKEGAKITIVTDDEPYSREIIQVLRQTEHLAPVFAESLLCQ